MRLLFSILTLCCLLPSRAQTLPQKTQTSENFVGRDRVTVHLLNQDSSGYYLLVNNDNLISYQHLTKDMKVDYEANVNADKKRTDAREPFTCAYACRALYEFSLGYDKDQNITTLYAQEVNSKFLQLKGDPIKLMSYKQRQNSDLTLAESEGGLALAFYDADSSAKSLVSQYVIFFYDSALQLKASKYIQVTKSYSLVELKLLRSGKVLLKWRKPFNPEREADLYMLVSSGYGPVRFLRPHLKDYETNDILSVELANGEIGLYGYYIHKRLVQTHGIFLFRYTQDMAQLQSEKFYAVDVEYHYSGASEEQRVSRDFEHYMLNLYEMDNGRIVMMGQYGSYQYLSGKYSRFTGAIVTNKKDTYVDGACFVYCLDSSKVCWTQKIAINETGSVFSFWYMTEASCFVNNNLYLVYNDRPGGHENNEATGFFVDDRCQQTLVKVSAEGQVTKDVLQPKIAGQRVLPFFCWGTTSGFVLVNRTPAKYFFQSVDF